VFWKEDAVMKVFELNYKKHFPEFIIFRFIMNFPGSILTLFHSYLGRLSGPFCYGYGRQKSVCGMHKFKSCVVCPSRTREHRACEPPACLAVLALFRGEVKY
jgi:hypothetical protein